MSNTEVLEHKQNADGHDNAVLDALIIGAGVSGIDQLHRLRSLGLNALVVDSAGGVGGTWYWNRYPGARLDSESYSYGYYFDNEILQQWDWPEHFCEQPTNEQYFNFVVDKLELRPHIRLNTTVTKATFDTSTNVWEVETDGGHRIRTKLVITGIGILSHPQYPNVPGRELFRGESHHTARWPASGVELEGKRVAVIGTGSSGVQIITAIGPLVGSLTVFQRTPNWCTPLNNGPISAGEMAQIKASYDDVWKSTQNAGGFVHNPIPGSAWDFTPEQRQERYESIYKLRGFAKSICNFPELMVDKRINEEFSAFLEKKIRGRVKNQDVADKLIPTDHGYGMKRPPYESGYYEIYNQPNVEIVDLLETPMTEITERGIKTSDREFEFDVIVYATGFDTITGAFNQIDFRGIDGKSLRDYWSHGAKTYVGLASHGFPNLFFLGGPQALGGNNPRAIEKQVDFVTDLVAHMHDLGQAKTEATSDACEAWTDHVNETAGMTLHSQANSWIFGSNTEGKPRAFGLYIGGMNVYGDRLKEIEKNGYEGFELS